MSHKMLYAITGLDWNWYSVESVWSSEAKAKDAHKRLHPRSKLAEPRCSYHEIEVWILDSDVVEPIDR